MKLPLVGGSYQARSTALAGATTINLYPELIQDPNVPPLGNTPSTGNAIIGKNIGGLFGCPGRHLFKDLTTIDAAATPIRCIYANPGGTRLFVAAGPRYMELNAAGTLVGSVRTIADDGAHSPVTMVANGTQLFIVSAGNAYLDAGSGPNLVSFPGSQYNDLSIGYSGIVTTNLYGVTLVSGSFFNEGMTGQSIVINSIVYTVGSVLGPTQLILTTSAGVNFAVSYLQGSSLTVNSPAQPFKAADVGATLNVTGGTGFTIQTVFILSVDAFGNASCTALMGSLGSSGGVAAETFPFSALTGTFLDGYFIVNAPNTRNFFISALNNGLVWDPLDVGVKESWPDYIRSVFATPQFLYLFGTESLEVWQNTGGTTTNTFPFQRINSASQRYGIVSAWSPAAVGGRVYFLASSAEGQLVACVFNGLTVQRISTHAEESQWNALGAATNCYSYAYVEEGHQFWVFSISGQSWHYDATAASLGFNPWAQRAQWNGSTFTTYATQFCAFVSQFSTGLYITGGQLDGKVYTSSLNFYDDNGSDIGWQRALSYLWNDGKTIYVGRAELEMETGTTPSGNPLVTLDWSKDRGHTFINAQTASMGTSGQTSVRVFWPNNGSGRQLIPRLTGHGQGKVALVDFDVEINLGTN